MHLVYKIHDILGKSVLSFMTNYEKLYNIVSI